MAVKNEDDALVVEGRVTLQEFEAEAHELPLRAFAFDSTGARGRFAYPGAQVAVDARDDASLDGVPKLRRVLTLAAREIASEVASR